MRTTRGATLTELLATSVLLLAVASAGVTAMGTRLRNRPLAVRPSTETTLALVASTLRQAGAGTVPGQPAVVTATPRSVAVNGDWLALDARDRDAVIVDPTRDSADAFGPDAAGQPRLPAETIAYAFEPDTQTPRRDDFLLVRRVNRGAPEIVLRGLRAERGRPFFEFAGMGGVELGAAPAPTAVRAVRVRFVAGDGAAARLHAITVPLPNRELDGSPR